MKKQLFLALLAMWLSETSAQTISPQVLASAGDTYEDQSIQLDWTVGEIAISTLQNANQQITQGFHQPYYSITNLEELPANIGAIQVFPNPTSDQLNIRLSLNTVEDIRIQLINLEGKTFWTKKLHGKEVSEECSLASLPNTTYFMQVIIGDKQFFKTFKIQKIY